MGIVIINPKCRNCLDSMLVRGLYGLEPCGCAQRVYFSRPAHILHQNIFRYGLNKIVWDANTVDIARLLTHGTNERPIPRAYFEEFCDLTAREVYEHIRVLKTDWRLPIVARRGEPNGYWFALSVDEYLQHEKPYVRQAYETLRISWGVRRANFPEFAGQEFFDFLKEQEGQPDAA